MCVCVCVYMYVCVCVCTCTCVCVHVHLQTLAADKRMSQYIRAEFRNVTKNGHIIECNLQYTHLHGNYK